MRKYRPHFFLVILILFFAILNPFGFMNPVKEKTQIIFSPAYLTFGRIGNGITAFLKTFSSIKKLNDENVSLKQKNLELQSKNTQYKEVEHENDLLRKEIGFMKNSKLSLFPAKIIARNPSGAIDTIYVDKGKKDGVKEGQAVITQGFLVGRVKQVNNSTSEILLITSSSSKIPVVLQDSRGTGLLQGGLKGLRIEDIPLDFSIKEGESILTNDMGQIIPKGIPVGQIKKVISGESEIARSAYVDSPVAFQRLEMVFISR
jgi:rod shape-determining protein MreC